MRAVRSYAPMIHRIANGVLPPATLSEIARELEAVRTNARRHIAEAGPTCQRNQCSAFGRVKQPVRLPL